MTDVRRSAERLHADAQIMHLDRQQDLALASAGVRSVGRSRSFPARVYTEGPWEVWARVRGGHLTATHLPSYEVAVNMAALWMVLAAAIDRAETVDPTTGDAA